MTSNDRPAFSRRTFLAVAAGSLGAAALPRLPRLPGAWAAPAVQAPGRVFTLGVASGGPRPDGVVLWTRLAPEPLTGGGMPPVAVPVRFEVAADDGFRRLVHAGVTMAEPGHAHSIHIDVTGLEPG